MNIKEIYDRQFSRVYRIALLFLKNTADAEDAAQNIFLKYIEKSVVFRDEEHEKAWFITVTRNYCKDVLKSFWHRNMRPGIVLESEVFEESNSEILEMIMLLSKKYREVLYLYYYEGYSVKEMSKILNRKTSTIQTQMSVARKKLKQMLEQEENDNERR